MLNTTDVKFQTQYRRLMERAFCTINEEASMTQQSDLAETDINILVAKFGVTGQMPQVLDEAIYGDFTDVDDYRSALEKIRAADEAFQTVPAKIREEFANDPAKFIEFAQNPANLEKMREWGLAPKAAPVIIPPEPKPNNEENKE